MKEVQFWFLLFSFIHHFHVESPDPSVVPGDSSALKDSRLSAEIMVIWKKYLLYFY